jgi:hypothetical protein
MERPIRLDDVLRGDWERVDRGETLEFFATDDDVNDWIAHLPTEYAPYTVLELKQAAIGTRRFVQMAEPVQNNHVVTPSETGSFLDLKPSDPSRT